MPFTTSPGLVGCGASPNSSGTRSGPSPIAFNPAMKVFDACSLSISHRFSYIVFQTRWFSALYRS